MRKIFFSVLGLFACLVFTHNVNAQKLYFKDISPAAVNMDGAKKVISPIKSRTFHMDFNEIKSFLWDLPKEDDLQNRNAAPVLVLPMPDGTNARFRVWESSIQEPGLQDKFPDIRTFAGKGIDDPYATIRFDLTAFGFHAQVRSAVTGGFYIDPYARGLLNEYMSYKREDLPARERMRCEYDPNAPENVAARNNMSTGSANLLAGFCRGDQLFTYRLAVACTGEYAVAVGGTTAALLHSAIVTSVNRVNGVYEDEVAVRMILVANNNLIEFMNAATDPFTGNNNGGVLINESNTQINQRIGASNYDIGHTFSTGGGGLAQLGCVCTSGKGRGITGSPNPVGDAYDIDYVAHEIGHQFGGEHTFNSTTSSCGGGNRSSSAAYEPGSGTTMMAYAGICGSDNIQPNSDPYFSTYSFDQITTFITNGSGNNCKQVISTGNAIPQVTAMGTSGLSIPINTPFTLTGEATDSDGDDLVYSWEEFDLGTGGAWNNGRNNSSSPLFKFRVPKTTGSRTFPDMAVILANYPPNPGATMGLSLIHI